MRVRAYVLILLAALALGCLLFLPGQLVLLRAGELLNFNQIIARQQQGDGLYFGLAEAPGNYKLAVYARRKPDIVILGSSRAHHEHQEFYSLPSYTMSGIVYTPADAIETMDLLIPIHKPKYVIYNLDYFAFCTRDPGVASQKVFSRPHGKPNTGWAWGVANRFRLVPDLLRDGQMKFSQALDLALGRFDRSPRGVPLIGINALLERRGFRLDGTLSPVDAVPQNPADMVEARREIASGKLQFEGGCYFSPVTMAHLIMFRQEMSRQGIHPIIVMPPISPDIYDLFMHARPDISGYYKIFLSVMAAHPIPEFYNHVDGASVGALESEFIDGYHGADVSEARSVLAAAKAPGSALSGIINRPFLEKLIAERAGEAQIELSYFQHVHPVAWGVLAPSGRR